MPTISFYIPEKIKTQLDKVAINQMRSVSNLVSAILKRGLEELTNDQSWLVENQRVRITEAGMEALELENEK